MRSVDVIADGGTIRIGDGPEIPIVKGSLKVNFLGPSLADVLAAPVAEFAEFGRIFESHKMSFSFTGTTEGDGFINLFRKCATPEWIDGEVHYGDKSEPVCVRLNADNSITLKAKKPTPPQSAQTES